jgi:hypothetical protein
MAVLEIPFTIARCFGVFVERRDKDRSREPIGGWSVYVTVRKIIKQMNK